MMEMFKNITGFEDYSITDQGKVISYKRSSQGQELTKFVKPDGYHYVSLMIKGKVHQRSVHRLVAEAFLPRPSLRHIVNHKNHNKIDNVLGNLEWVTYRENTNHHYTSILTSSNFEGVYKVGESFLSSICALDHPRVYLGSYTTGLEASEVYKKAVHILTNLGIEALVQFKESLYDKHSSKYMDVSFDKSRDKWIASVRFHKKQHLRKRFNTETLAVEAVIEKCIEIGKPLHFSHTSYLSRKVPEEIKNIFQNKETLK